MVFEKKPLDRRLSLNPECTVVSVQMQPGLVFCPGPKKMTNVSNDKHNALVWSNPEEGKDQISPGSQQKGHAKKSCSIKAWTTKVTHTQISKSDEKNVNTYLLKIVLSKWKFSIVLYLIYYSDNIIIISLRK